MATYRLRIELRDRPGALAGVTGEIAAHNANIISIDVHEIDGDTAVDEIVVAVGEDWVPGPLAAALAASGSGNLLSSRRMTTIDDPMVGALEAVAAMISGDQELTRSAEAEGICTTPCWARRRTEGRMEGRGGRDRFTSAPRRKQAAARTDR